MHLLYLVPLLIVLPSCSKGEENRSKTQARENVRVPEDLRRYVYPGAKVERVYAGREASGITMRSPDPIEKVAKFYLDRLGLPDDKVVDSRVVSYLYKGGDRDVLITIEKNDGGSIVSVSITGG